MKTKDLFKALKAGAQVMIEETWPWIIAGIFAILGAGISHWVFGIQNIIVIITVSIATALIVRGGCEIFICCKEVIKIAEDENVDLKTAWRYWRYPHIDDFF